MPNVGSLFEDVGGLARVHVWIDFSGCNRRARRLCSPSHTQTVTSENGSSPSFKQLYKIDCPIYFNCRKVIGAMLLNLSAYVAVDG